MFPTALSEVGTGLKFTSNTLTRLDSCAWRASEDIIDRACAYILSRPYGTFFDPHVTSVFSSQ
jgi:hypothetical protein